MQFKKIAAIAGSALMAGLTIATPVLGATVSEVGKINDLVTVEDSTVAFPTFVVGANALTADVAGAINVAVKMAANAKTTEMISSEGGMGTSVTGGVKLSTAGDQITPGTSIGAVKSVLTNNDLPTILATNTFQTATGSNHEYKQYLYVDEGSNHIITYGKESGADEPVLALKTTANNALYRYKLTFSTPVTGWSSQTTLDAALKGQTFNILGKDFVISETVWANNAIDSITVLGGKNTETIATGEDKTIGDYTVHLDAVVTENVGGGSYTAVGNVDGESFSIASGSTHTLSDGTVIAAIKVWQGKTGEADYAKITVGADKIKMPKAGSITRESTIDSTVDTTITSSDTNGWSALEITYTPDEEVWNSEGSVIADAFSDTFDIQFAGIVPALDSSSRQMIEFLPDSLKMNVKYENAGGVEYTLPSLYYDSGWEWTSDGANRDVFFDESAAISAQDKDYFVIQKAGFSHIMQFVSMTNTTATNFELTFKDEAGNSITSSATYTPASLTADGKLIVDGNEFAYNILNPATTVETINMDLNGDATIANTTAGMATSWLMPKNIAKDKGGLYFFKGNVSNTTLLGDTMDIGLAGGLVLGNNNYSLDNGATWTAFPSSSFTVAHPTAFYDLGIQCISGTCTAYIGTGQPGYVLVEEGGETSTVHNWIYFPVLYDSTKDQTYIGATSSDSAYTRYSITGSSGEYKAMTTYGTLVHELGLNNGGEASASYPDEYTYANVYVLEPEGAVTTAVTEGGDVASDKIFVVTSDVAKLDSEVTDTGASDMVLVGGPCVHSLVADLADAGKFAYTCDTWPAENFGWIEVIPDAFAEGKTVLIIAGTRAQDTDLAARVVQDGTKLAGKTTSSAKVTGESFASVVVA